MLSCKVPDYTSLKTVFKPLLIDPRASGDEWKTSKLSLNISRYRKNAIAIFLYTVSDTGFKETH